MSATVSDAAIVPPATLLPVMNTSMVRARSSLWLGVRLFVQPRAAGAALVRTPLWKAIGIALFNFVCIVPHLLLVQTVLEWVQQLGAVGKRPANVALYSLSGYYVPSSEAKDFFLLLPRVMRADQMLLAEVPVQELISQSVAFLLLYLALAALVFFMVLPFAARKGSNRACVMHVVRTALSATGLVHIVFPALCVLYLLLHAFRGEPSLGAADYIDTFVRSLAMVSVVGGLGLIGIIRSSMAEYRKPEDLPQAHDPLCEFCGYNLTMTPMDSRCPECGTAVVKSLALDARVPTAWETTPRVGNVALVFGQISQLVVAPTAFFRRMLLHSNKQPVERWLVFSMVMVALTAFLIAPATIFLGIDPPRSRADIINPLLAGVAISVAWTCLAMMMVGVETTGLATFSHMRGRRVDLGAAAKVTSYASILMLFWVLLAGTHLLVGFYLIDHGILWRYARIHYKLAPYILVGSLAAAHIGGLLWFEITVYRGLRTVQYANR